MGGAGGSLRYPGELLFQNDLYLGSIFCQWVWERAWVAELFKKGSMKNLGLGLR